MAVLHFPHFSSRAFLLVVVAVVAALRATSSGRLDVHDLENFTNHEGSNPRNFHRRKVVAADREFDDALGKRGLETKSKVFEQLLSGENCDPSRRPIYIFLHALKSGGTLVSNILRTLNVSSTCLGSSQIGKLQPNSPTNWDEEAACKYAFFHEDVSVSSIIRKHTDRCLHFLTLVRDPVELRQALFRTYTVGVKMVRQFGMTQAESDEWTHAHYIEYVQNHTREVSAKAAAAAAAAVANSAVAQSGARDASGPGSSSSDIVAEIANAKMNAIWGGIVPPVRVWNGWKDSYPPETTYLMNMMLGLGVGGGDAESPFKSHWPRAVRDRLVGLAPDALLAMATSQIRKFHFIGLTSRFAESMCLLAFSLREPALPFLKHRSRHVADEPTRLSSEWPIPADVYRATLRLAGPDSALYDQIEDLVEKRIISLQAEVQAAFARVNDLGGSADSGQSINHLDNELLKIARNKWCIESQLFVNELSGSLNLDENGSYQTTRAAH